jgi:hypothetical protein
MEVDMAFQPFTLRERIQQLNGIDKVIPTTFYLLYLAFFRFQTPHPVK